MYSGEKKGAKSLEVVSGNSRKEKEMKRRIQTQLPPVLDRTMA